MVMTVADYLQHLGSAAEDLASEATEAGLDRPVPTCPEWTVADLVAHVGTVHRWATAIVSDARPGTELPSEELAAGAPSREPSDLLRWYSAGAAGLVAALAAAPEDLVAPVFLHAAPLPRVFWARRQAHETVIHRVDALGAVRGRFPTAAETRIAPDLAVDGIDEILVGFAGRRSSRLRSDAPWSVLIAPTDVEAAWTVAVSADAPVTTRGADHEHPADAVLSGSAVALYLGLWNRGDEVAQVGQVDALGRWREAVRVTWG